MKLCDYGCGQEAKFTFKNGKKCCSKNHSQCPNKKLSSHDYKNNKSHEYVYCKYCNKKLFYSNLKQHEPKCYLNPKNIKRCLECNDIIKTGNKFCSTSCSASYNNKRRSHSKETKIKIGKSVKKVSSMKLKNKNLSIKPIKKETIVIVTCPICKSIKKIKTSAPASIKKIKTCSKKCFKKYLSIKIKESGAGGYRKGSGHSKSGYYKGIYCSSTYELIFLAYHLDIGSSIKKCQLKIPYVYKGTNHHYYPDFEIDNIIYEIKGYYTKIVDIKTNATINYGYKIKVLYLEKLTPMLKYLQNKFKFKNILELYDNPPNFDKICKYCQKSFKTFKKDQILCSRSCSGKYKRNILDKMLSSSSRLG